MTTIPDAVQRVVTAINDADLDAFVAAFAPDGQVDDWGRVLSGSDGVRSWGESDAIGAGAQMSVVESDTDGEVTHLVFDWTSRVFNGRSHAYVTVRGGLVHEFRIPPNH